MTKQAEFDAPLSDEDLEFLAEVAELDQVAVEAGQRLVRDLRAARALLGASKSFLRHLTPEAQGTAGAALLVELSAFLGGPSGEG